MRRQNSSPLPTFLAFSSLLPQPSPKHKAKLPHLSFPGKGASDPSWGPSWEEVGLLGSWATPVAGNPAKAGASFRARLCVRSALPLKPPESEFAGDKC